MMEDKCRALAGRLDETTLRLWAAVEDRTLGWGGVSTVAKATGMSRTTICSGLEELESPPSLAPARPGPAALKRPVNSLDKDQAGAVPLLVIDVREIDPPKGLSLSTGGC